MIQSFTFHGLEKGPRLLILGAVHGNEVCGTTAIRRVVAEIESGAFDIAKGHVTFVPVCNPRAFAEGKRFIERNLNRHLVPQKNPDCYEARLGNRLCALIEDCDALLDLHSYPEGGKPFAFVGVYNPDERAFAASLGVQTLLTGWEDAYKATGRSTAASPDEGVGTEEYARRCGKIASILECGDHKDPHAPEVAYRAIRNALVHFGMAVFEDSNAAKTEPPHLVTVQQVFYRDHAEDKMTRDWRHLDPVKKGEMIASPSMVAPEDGFVVLPDAHAAPGCEWFYFGIERPLECSSSPLKTVLADCRR